MIFWVVAGVLVLAAVLALIAPLARRRAAAADRAEHGLSVLKDQLGEIERDHAAGRLADEEAGAARLEVQRRILAEADRIVPEDEDAEIADTRWRRFVVAAVVILGVPAATAVIYLDSGRPNTPDLPLSARSEERTRMAEIAQRQRGLAEMVENLEKRLAEQPDDINGWMVLGRTHLTMGDFERAVEAFRRSAAIGGGPEAVGEMAEAMVRRDRGIVTPNAQKAFAGVLTQSPGDARARYYIALAALQAGEPEQALRLWLELADDTPPEAPWRAGLLTRIEELAAESGLDLAALRAEVAKGRPVAPRGPSAADVAAAQSMAPQDRVAMIRGMVEGLQARLELNPDDIEGWQRLGRSWQVLGEEEKSVAAYREAALRAPDSVEVQLDYARALFPAGTDKRAMSQDFIDVIARVREIAPDHPQGLFFGGIVAIRSGDTSTARDLWTRLLAVLPADSPIRGAIEQQLSELGGG